MTLLRSLGMPFHLTGLMFVGFSSVLLALLDWAAKISPLGVLGPLCLVPAFLLISWLFKYSFVLLEATADGMHAPPVVTVEMLSPLEATPWILALFSAMVYFGIRRVGGVAGEILTGCAVSLLPVMVGVLGASGRIAETFNPLTWLRVLRGLGIYYLLILLFVALLAMLVRLLFKAQVGGFVRYALLEFSIMTIFSLIGGTIYARRLELGHQPRASPERIQAVVDCDYEKRRQKVLDEAFTLVRARQYRNTSQPLRAWLDAADEQHLSEDVRHLISTALQWSEARGGETVAQAVIGWLIENHQLPLALQSLDLVLKTDPTFVLESDAQTQSLARFAAANGRPKFAQALQPKV